MPRIRGKPVGHINGRAGSASEQWTGSHTRLRFPVSRDGFGRLFYRAVDPQLMDKGKTGRGRPDCPRQINIIACAGPGTPDDGTLGRFSESRNRQAYRTAGTRRIAAIKRYAIGFLIGPQAIREIGYPAFFRGNGQAEGQEITDWHPSRCRDIGEIHPQQLSGNRPRRVIGEEMHTGNDRIEGNERFATRADFQTGHIIIQPVGTCGVSAQRREIPFYE